MAESHEPTPLKVHRGGDADPLVGKHLAGRFEILQLIDRGGMGKIYRAVQHPLGREVALKTLDVVDHTGEFKKRFFLEASACAKLTHPNTVRIFDYGVDEGVNVYFLVMEFLTGAQLHQLIAEQAPLEPLRALQIARQIAGALAEAHDKGIIHRDLKPQNVFLTRHGDDQQFVKVVDFGLVKELGIDSEVSKTGNVLGSPMYMAPEQVESEDCDQRTDIYALGLILYVMLTGQTPFKKGNALAVMMQQVHKEPPTFAEVAPGLKLPVSLEWVVQTCIRKQKDERPASMREVVRVLRAVEREIRGDIPPLKLRLQDGAVVLPDGADVTMTEEVRLPQQAIRTTAPDESSGSMSIVRSMTQPAPLALGFAGVLFLAAGGLIGVSALVVGATLVLGAGSDASVTAPTPPPVVVEPAPVAVEPNPVAEPAPVEAVAAVPVQVTVESDPSGAEVLEDGVVVGNTPYDLSLAEGEAKVLEVSAPGRQKKSVRVDGSQASVMVSLARSGGSRPTKTPTTTPTTTPEPADTTPKRVEEVRNPFD